MTSLDFTRGTSSASMAPQLTASFFAMLLGLMLLFPFVRVSAGGAQHPELLIHLIRTDFGLNIFALLLLLTPLAGIIVAMLGRSAWAIGSALVAIIGIVLVPITIFTLQAEMRSSPNALPHVSAGVGTFAFPIIFGILAVTSALAALRARRVLR